VILVGKGEKTPEAQSLLFFEHRENERTTTGVGDHLGTQCTQCRAYCFI